MSIHADTASSENRNFFQSRRRISNFRLLTGKSRILLFLLGVGIFTELQAEPGTVLAPVKPEEFSDLKAGTPLPYPEQNAMLLNNSRGLFTKLVPVDTGKRYRLSGEFRLAPDSDELSVVFAIVPHTADGTRIYGPNICFVPDSETVLVADARKGDAELKVKDTAKWDMTAASCIGKVAFGIDPSGKQGDLPNFNLSPFISKVTPDGVVTLKKPMEKDYPAGTPVRLHLDRKFFGIFKGFEKLGDQWRTLDVIVSPGSLRRPLSTPALYDWWPGTTKAAILLYPFVPKGMPEGSGILFRNIKLEECD